MDKKAALILISISFFNISVKKTHGYVTQCNSNYCLYSNLTSRQYNGVYDANRECVQMNSSGWLLEVYDENISSLVDNFTKQYYSQFYGQYILLNVKTSGGWNWTNKATFNTVNSGAIKNQEDANRVVAYLKRTSQGNLDYNADTIYGINNGFCQINSPNCAKDSNWIRNPHCYINIPASYTWYEAENECIKQGGNLSVLDDLDLNVIDKTWVQSWGLDSFWVGLSRLHHTWVKKDVYVTFSKWKSGYPSIDVNLLCTAISPKDNNYWVNVGCYGNFVTVCMTENTTSVSSSTTTIPTTPTPSVPNSSTSFLLTSTTLGTSNNITQFTSTPNDKSQEERIRVGVGVGVGVPLTLLALVAVVGVVVYMWRRKMGCFKRQQTAQPQKLEETTGPIYATPVMAKKPTNLIPNNGLIDYVQLDFTGENKHNNNLNNVDNTYSTVDNTNASNSNIDYNNNNNSDYGNIGDITLNDGHNYNRETSTDGD